ncbi:hypothetical protein EC957_004606 [Mortierella hygrophila]|uniref:Uncharacterized protein n=1 Tax=Mortierella hygrophila TaxID=979708 RepID=A0A9P6K062_9FUNG|nr:hypothetical protein EC957_004606 [Mortierella hygrophila]
MNGDKIQFSLDKNQKDAQEMAEEIKQRMHKKIAKRYGSRDRSSSIERDTVESFKSKEGETVKTKLFEMLGDDDAGHRKSVRYLIRALGDPSCTTPCLHLQSSSALLGSLAYQYSSPGESD